MQHVLSADYISISLPFLKRQKDFTMITCLHCSADPVVEVRQVTSCLSVVYALVGSVHGLAFWRTGRKSGTEADMINERYKIGFPLAMKKRQCISIFGCIVFSVLFSSPSITSLSSPPQHTFCPCCFLTIGVWPTHSVPKNTCLASFALRARFEKSSLFS